MTNEASIVELGVNAGTPIRFTVSDSTGIEKGTILKLSGDRTAIATSGSGDAIAGIAATEKVASDGSTTLGAYTTGIFDIFVASGATVALGEWVSSSGANVVKPATEAELQAGKGIGRALEAGDKSEQILVKVMC